ncbi:MAG TPA: pyrroloquinoline quinone-dependent dehydrogenase [Rhodothermales bacterium]|nr:pyrroloquinoline quinone-dependent dehydrogenase [Rhodothermales bacterium]
MYSFMRASLKKYRAGLFLALIPVLALAVAARSGDGQDRDWPVYLGDKGATHYSPLTQIDKENAKNLEVAWTYHTGDLPEGNTSQIQCNPIIVDGVLYGTTPALKLFALDAATGKEIWQFDPFEVNAATDIAISHGVNRGVVYWRSGDDARILYTAGSYIHAVDARTGKLVRSFGKNGVVDMRKNLGWEDIGGRFVISNTPGVVYKNLLILGMRLSESQDAAPGPIRAYDIRTGKMVWRFNTIPRPGEYGYHTWPKEAYKTVGGANAWTGLTLDEERGIVYVPTGSAAFDFYGGNRKGMDLFANTLLALDANTGRRIWHFQFVHHDLWDRDLPAPPALVTVMHEGKKVDAVAQITKSGWVFLFDRETGEPLFPIQERPVPASDVPGEEAWHTQPLPTSPPPFARQCFDEDIITNLTPEAHAYILEQSKKYRTGCQFVPPSLEGSIILPGLDGGGEWGGAAVDPDGMLYVNANEMAWILKLVPTEAASLGEHLFLENCSRCHGSDRSGDVRGGIPSLLNLGDRYEAAEVSQLLQTGRRGMPSFQQLSEAQRTAIVNFLLDIHQKEPMNTVKEAEGAHPIPDLPYAFAGYTRFLDQNGYPAVKPPWGTLTAINLNEGKIAWQVPFGELPELTAKGIPQTGTENYGGPVVTAGGLIFIGATKDEKFRVFDKDTGEVLFEAQLPAGGYATPATYMIDGKQYVVIACGGGKMNTKSGDAYVAFALPG